MLLSTSSFNKLSTAKCWLQLATLVCTSVFGICWYENVLRTKGYQPAVIDSPMLWSIQRDIANHPNSLVFAGASRTQFGIDLDAVNLMLPGHAPSMLAVNGRYPLATLKHLAESESFDGIVLLDIDARGLHTSNHLAQEAYGDYYQDQWSPNWKIHRMLLTQWQKNMALARPAHSLSAILVRAISNAGPPFRFHSFIHSNRSGYIDFDLVNNKDLADHFAQGLAQDLENNPPPPPEKWLGALTRVAQWVSAIESRGGSVIFYEPPVQARQKALADTAYPRDNYWDAFINQHQFSGITFRDVPELQKFDLPDESHIAKKDKTAYTRVLISTLIEKQFIRQ
ncbi:hypothetical protein [Gilvimarinus chinensis]|uniref:hypothetical protein n=1 Tax=Gilvimarinus chinensis TaxID=396005 RepID=UPI00037EDC31|nr:hypothetical protein [Gilvimarinus chinensis]